MKMSSMNLYVLYQDEKFKYKVENEYSPNI